MTNDTERLQVELQAVYGFVEWLTSTLPEQPGDSLQYSKQVLRVLEFYSWEIERQIDATPALQSWFELVALTSMLAIILKDDLLGANPGLENYRPSDEPTTVNEMTIRLLSNALRLFETAQGEMAGYLEIPQFPGLLEDFEDSRLQTTITT